MASINTTTDDPNRDWSAFRFGQVYSYENARFIGDRDAYGRLITRVLVEEALGPGFEAVDPETEEVLPWSDEMWKIISKDWEQFIYGWELQRTFEWAITGIFESDNPLNAGKPFLRSFEPADTDQGETQFYNDGSLQATKLRIHQKNANDEWYFVGDIEVDQDQTIQPIENVFFVVYQKKRQYWKGRSDLEVVWDIIWGLRAIHMGCTIFAIRKGSGLRLIIMPPGPSDETVTDVRSAAKSLDSIDGFFLLPPGADVKIDAQGQADYNSLKDVLLRALSAVLKIPKARLDGIEPGNLEGAKVNEEQMFDFWRRIQRLARPMVEWMVERYNTYYQWFPQEAEEDIDTSGDALAIIEPMTTAWKPLFRIRAELSESEKAEVLSTNVEAYTSAINSNLISIPNAQKELGFPVEEVDNPMPALGQLRITGEDEDEGPIAEEKPIEK